MHGGGRTVHRGQPAGVLEASLWGASSEGHQRLLLCASAICSPTSALSKVLCVAVHGGQAHTTSSRYGMQAIHNLDLTLDQGLCGTAKLGWRWCSGPDSGWFVVWVRTEEGGCSRNKDSALHRDDAHLGLFEDRVPSCVSVHRVQRLLTLGCPSGFGCLSLVRHAFCMVQFASPFLMVCQSGSIPLFGAC